MGEPAVPRPWLEAALAGCLVRSAGKESVPRVRIVRFERGWALVEVGHTWLGRARSAWNGPIDGPAGRRAVITTHRTWGTLRGGKAWLRGHAPEVRPRARAGG